MVTEETFCVHISRGECLRLSSNEKRYRNRSLCNQLYTPPSYPGYTSTISGLNNSSCGLLARRNSPRWPSNEHDRCQVKSPQRSHSTVHRASYLSAQPIFSIVTDIEQLSHSDDFKVIHGDRSDCSSPRKDLSFKDSSGYGSGSSYSDLENEQPTYASCEHKTMTNDSASEAMYSKRKHSKSKLEKNLRRRSVPANMRDAFSDEIMHVLEIGGVLQYETNADTGVATPIMNGHSINRPESVVELARKFSAAAAAQNNRLFYMNQRCHKSNSGPSTPIHRRMSFTDL
ncbi:hypothetical protein AB6A40_003133 [Gnathostoma spinigerum]|uniref:Uncharacterized protein n=1 Tax=Gnathostoma spinigerum TaxID=75299 RepID=A0ABD6E8N5_9BILA